MAFIGTPLDTRNTFQSLQGKRFSGDGSTSAFTLDIIPSSVFDIEVFVENVRQDPNSAYGISGTTLTFTGAPPSGTNNIYVIHQAKAVGTIDVPALGVSTASLQANSVTGAKLNTDVISAQTALGAAPADTDEFLVSDAGTIKRIDYSLIKGGNNTPHFSVSGSGQNISNATWTKLNGSSEFFDVGGAYDASTNYRFNVPSDGVYFFGGTASFNGLGDNVSYGLRFYVDGSNVNRGRAYIQHAGSSDGEGYISSTILLDLNASQYVELYVFQGDGTTNATTSGTVFTGFKLIGL